MVQRADVDTGLYPEGQEITIHNGVAEPAPVQGELEYEAYSKGDVVPFVPLHREIGVSYLPEIEIRELSLHRQRTIHRWVGDVKETYDMIQRAEGRTNPYAVYNGARKRYLDNIADPEVKDEVVASHESGRAAIHRYFETTQMHYDIAKERFAGGQLAFRKIRKKQQLSIDDAKYLDEALQEMANGLAANLDNCFPGGDKLAVIAGNSVLYMKDKIIEGSVVDRMDYATLIAAALNYIKKQTRVWESALDDIRAYASKNRITLGKKRELAEA